MKKNMSNTDRIIRAIIAILIAILFFTGTLTGLVGTVLLVLAVVFLATSFLSFCPLYKVFGLSTRQEEKA